MAKAPVNTVVTGYALRKSEDGTRRILIQTAEGMASLNLGEQILEYGDDAGKTWAEHELSRLGKVLKVKPTLPLVVKALPKIVGEDVILTFESKADAKTGAEREYVKNVYFVSIGEEPFVASLSDEEFLAD